MGLCKRHITDCSFLRGCAAGDLVAHIKFTVLLMPNGSDRITSVPLQPLQSSVTVEDPDVKAILNLSYKSKKKSAAKKKGECTFVRFISHLFYFIEARVFFFKSLHCPRPVTNAVLMVFSFCFLMLFAKAGKKEEGKEGEKAAAEKAAE